MRAFVTAFIAICAIGSAPNTGVIAAEAEFYADAEAKPSGAKQSTPGGPGGGTTSPYIPLVDWETRLNVEERLQPLGDDLMGDQIDPHTGAISFQHTDISIPGDFDLPVSLGRQLRQGKEYGLDAVEFGDWELTAPRLRVVTATLEPWTGNRCSDSFGSQFSTVSYFSQTVRRQQYSNGIQVEVGGSSTLLMESPMNARWPSTATHVTESNWYFECAGGGSTFVGHAPDGSTYEFNRHIVRGAMPLETTGTPRPLARETHILAATQVTDRHGNWVRYTYDGYDRLTRIHASDGREITLSYNGTSKLIASATANGRTWTYSYRAGTASDGGYITGAWGGGGTVLGSVTLPDARSWTFALDAMQTATPPTRFCLGGGGLMQVTHPSGAQGEFVTRTLQHRFDYHITTEQPTLCPEHDLDSGAGSTPGFWPYSQAITAGVISVTRKTLTSPDAVTVEWLYEYEQDDQTGTSFNDPTNWTKITGPESHVTLYHYWNNQPEGGALAREEIRATAGGPILQTREFEYVMEGRFGVASHFGNAAAINGHNDVRRTVRTTTTRDGVTYTSESDFITDDTNVLYSWGNPVELRSFSDLTGAHTRTVQVEYRHDTTDWVLGLPERVTRNGKVFEDITYNAANLPSSIDHFGVTVETRSYNTDGTMAWVRDALNRQTSFANYHRGYPRTITRADSTQITLTVDDNGWITSITDARGTTTGYDYTASGWLSLIDRPAGFADTTISYSQLGAGVIATSTTGALSTITEHDRFHRPLRVERRALSGGGGSIFTRFEYDALGRAVFESFPSAIANPTTGSTTSYDALGRVTQTAESVAPFATTTTAYLTDNRVQVTDPMGHVITTWRSGYGGPDDGQTLQIDHPLGLTTEMSYDIWGNLLTARQHGSHSGFTVDETQTWTYDNRLRLCRHVTPETGATQYSYDNANQMLTVARGMAPTAACGTAGASSTTVHSYDVLGQLIGVDYPDSAPDVAMSYDANGNLLTATRGITAWSYAYDVMDQLTAQTLTVDGRTYATSYTYEADGRLHSTVLPDASQIFHVADGHGRPTAARLGGFDYASNALYHPSGQIESFDYGNTSSLTHSFNARQQITDVFTIGTINPNPVQDHSYTYDAMGRVVDIIVHMAPSENRTHSYDALGRLSTASGPWGAGSYTYDLLNNIRSKTLGPDTVQIEYNAANQIARARDTRDGNIWRTYLHDARGNVIDNDRLSFTYDRSDQPVAMGGAVSATYAYDAHNRRVKQVIDGETIYSVYGTGGDLLYRDNITTGEETINLTLGSRPVARLITQGGITTPTYLYPDHLGTASLAANASGYITWWESYSPFGETLNNAPQGFNQPGFTGHIRDTATGLNYMQARYYDPVIGRFLSNDPVGFATANPGGVDPRYFNRYAYVYNDPVNGTDPTGMCGPLTGACLHGLRIVAAGARAAIRFFRGNKRQAPPVVIDPQMLPDADEGGGENSEEGSDGPPTGDDVIIGDKIKEQLGGRGWTEEEVRELTEGEPSGTSTDNTGGQSTPATVYGPRDGHVVINNETGEVVQISDKNDPNWIPDDRIEWNDEAEG